MGPALYETAPTFYVILLWDGLLRKTEDSGLRRTENVTAAPSHIIGKMENELSAADQRLSWALYWPGEMPSMVLKAFERCATSE